MDIWQYYETLRPGEVQVLGADVFNGSQAQLRSFKNIAPGMTFPLLLNAGTSTGGNVRTFYGDRDVWVVINRTGIVRYSSIIYPYGDRYHLDQIRGAVDTLVSPPMDVSDATPRGRALIATPNPFSAHTIIEFANPAEGAARITVYDFQGRRVATLWNSPATKGITRISWDGRDERGEAVPPGIYVVRGEIGGVTLARRVTRLQ